MQSALIHLLNSNTTGHSVGTLKTRLSGISSAPGAQLAPSESSQVSPSPPRLCSPAPQQLHLAYLVTEQRFHCLQTNRHNMQDEVGCFEKVLYCTLQNSGSVGSQYRTVQNNSKQAFLKIIIIIFSLVATDMAKGCQVGLPNRRPLTHFQ